MVRVVGAQEPPNDNVSLNRGDTDTSVGLQLELKGLSNVGVDNESFLRDAIRGYSALAPEPRP